MPLTPGTRLGAYEIISQIGAGGMGEVYQATDPRLKRHVAIKVLPAALADDPDRLARFRREAEVLASLNHPNIAAIHGLEESGATTAIVMELVEGPTLADLIAQTSSGYGLQASGYGRQTSGTGLQTGKPSHGVAVADVLAMARQIADALAAAHAQGVVHRDLKPANIKLTVRGPHPHARKTTASSVDSRRSISLTASSRCWTLAWPRRSMSTPFRRRRRTRRH